MSRQVSDNINTSFNTTQPFNNTWNNYTVVNEGSGILTWLSLLEPQSRRKDIGARRVDEIGDWLLRTEEYRNWLGGIRRGKSAGSALFCPGGPGVGKTYIR